MSDSRVQDAFESIEAISGGTERLASALGVSADRRRVEGSYACAEEHLFDHLVVLSLRLKRYILTYWYRMADRSGGLNDTLVSVDEMLRFFEVGDVSAPELAANLETVERELAHAAARLQRRLSESERHVFLPLRELRDAFALDDLAVDVLVAASAPSLDVGFERLYRYAWADFTRRQVTPFFLGELLGPTAALRARVRECLRPSHALRRFLLVAVEPDTAVHEASRNQGTVSVPNRVVSFLLGEREPDDEHLAFLQLYRTGPPLDRLVIEERAKAALRSALETAHGGQAKLILTGADGVGKVSLARALAMERRRPLLKVDLLALAANAEAARYQLRSAVREAVLQGADLVLDDDGQFRSAEDVGDLLEPILATFGLCPTPVYFVTDGSPMWLHGRRDDVVEIEIALPPPRGQRELWTRAFEGAELAKHIDLGEIVQRYSLSAGSIHRAAAEARRLAEIRGGRGGEVRLDDLVVAVRHQFHHRLGSLAQPISTNLRWDDVVLPESLIVRIREIIAYARHRETVFDKWGFRQKMSYGRGLSCMFAGPPGTGKTMMVCIIARELGRELFRVDVARVVDKYIGETEKNLARVFEEAERSQAIILFDEADSLFSKRTDVKSSHDRYANLEVNYLLQRMEEFDGASFLTTNAETNIDEAFERRLKFKLTFPMPDAKERERLWHAMVPPEAEMGRDVDWRGLAEEFEMSGGLIKNAVLRGAFLAAEARTSIGHEILYRAALTELKDAGHVIRDDIHRNW